MRRFPHLSRRRPLGSGDGARALPVAPVPAAVGNAPRGRRGLRLVVLMALAAGIGFGLERAGLLDWRAGVALAQGHVDSWWLAPLVALVTAVLFAAGLPGSAMVFVAGILFAPLIAAPTFVVGGVVGAMGAYSLARAAGRSGEREAGDGRLLRLLARRSDFATLLAVRVAPSFPHTAINFASGLLGIPRGRFLASTALGLAIKGTLYVNVIHQAAGAATMAEVITWRTLAPLAGLALLLLLAPPLLRRLRGGLETPETQPPPVPVAVPVEPA
ncbi:MAG: VTT domain-containing protein [Thermoanaerobaculia bacterium]|nr:VTT domain-containing protein [Thermoanaerobaculia bacterium]